GDRVFGLVGGGAWAEQVVVHEREIARVPDAVTLEAAGASAEVFATAWDALTARAALVPGETVLVHAVGSGVGTAALQLAQALGCPVVGTSRRAWKLERATELGMRFGIDSGNLASLPIELSKVVPRGADVIIDLVGGAMVAEDVRMAAPQGR